MDTNYDDVGKRILFSNENVAPNEEQLDEDGLQFLDTKDTLKQNRKRPRPHTSIIEHKASKTNAGSRVLLNAIEREDALQKVSGGFQLFLRKMKDDQAQRILNLACQKFVLNEATIAPIDLLQVLRDYYNMLPPRIKYLLELKARKCFMDYAWLTQENFENQGGFTESEDLFSSDAHYATNEGTRSIGKIACNMPPCEFIFSSEQGGLEHILQLCQRLRTPICTMCIQNAADLKEKRMQAHLLQDVMHLLNHPTAYMYACHFCGSAFACRNKLTTHSCPSFSQFLASTSTSRSETLEVKSSCVLIACAECGAYVRHRPCGSTEEQRNASMSFLCTHNTHSLVPIVIYFVLKGIDIAKVTIRYIPSFLREYEISCSRCRIAWFTPEESEAHFSDLGLHPDEDLHSCRCGRKFSVESNLKEHLLECAQLSAQEPGTSVSQMEQSCTFSRTGANPLLADWLSTSACLLSSAGCQLGTEGYSDKIFGGNCDTSSSYSRSEYVSSAEFNSDFRENRKSKYLVDGMDDVVDLSSLEIKGLGLDPSSHTGRSFRASTNFGNPLTFDPHNVPGPSEEFSVPTVEQGRNEFYVQSLKEHCEKTLTLDLNRYAAPLPMDGTSPIYICFRCSCFVRGSRRLIAHLNKCAPRGDGVEHNADDRSISFPVRLRSQFANARFYCPECPRSVCSLLSLKRHLAMEHAMWSGGLLDIDAPEDAPMVPVTTAIDNLLRVHELKLKSRKFTSDDPEKYSLYKLDDEQSGMQSEQEEQPNDVHSGRLSEMEKRKMAIEIAKIWADGRRESLEDKDKEEASDDIVMRDDDADTPMDDTSVVTVSETSDAVLVGNICAAETAENEVPSIGNLLGSANENVDPCPCPTYTELRAGDEVPSIGNPLSSANANADSSVCAAHTDPRVDDEVPSIGSLLPSANENVDPSVCAAHTDPRVGHEVPSTGSLLASANDNIACAAAPERSAPGIPTIDVIPTETPEAQTVTKAHPVTPKVSPLKGGNQSTSNSTRSSTSPKKDRTMCAPLRTNATHSVLKRWKPNEDHIHCLICDAIMAKEPGTILQSHMRRHKENLTTCYLCDDETQFPNFAELLNHLSTTHIKLNVDQSMNKFYQCTICRERVSRYDGAQHLVYFCEKLVHCIFCGETVSGGNYKEHLAKVHAGSFTRFLCSECPFLSCSLKKMIGHHCKEEANSTVNRCECNIPTVFENEHHFQMHFQYRHLLNNKCTFCGVPAEGHDIMQHMQIKAWPTEQRVQFSDHQRKIIVLDEMLVADDAFFDKKDFIPLTVYDELIAQQKGSVDVTAKKDASATTVVDTVATNTVQSDQPSRSVDVTAKDASATTVVDTVATHSVQSDLPSSGTSVAKEPVVPAARPLEESASNSQSVICVYDVASGAVQSVQELALEDGQSVQVTLGNSSVAVPLHSLSPLSRNQVLAALLNEDSEASPSTSAQNKKTPAKELKKKSQGVPTSSLPQQPSSSGLYDLYIQQTRAELPDGKIYFPEVNLAAVDSTSTDFRAEFMFFPGAVKVSDVYRCVICGVRTRSNCDDFVRVNEGNVQKVVDTLGPQGDLFQLGMSQNQMAHFLKKLNTRLELLRERAIMCRGHITDQHSTVLLENIKKMMNTCVICCCEEKSECLVPIPSSRFLTQRKTWLTELYANHAPKVKRAIYYSILFSPFEQLCVRHLEPKSFRMSTYKANNRRVLKNALPRKRGGLSTNETKTLNASVFTAVAPDLRAALNALVYSAEAPPVAPSVAPPPAPSMAPPPAPCMDPPPAPSMAPPPAPSMAPPPAPPKAKRPAPPKAKRPAPPKAKRPASSVAPPPAPSMARPQAQPLARPSPPPTVPYVLGYPHPCTSCGCLLKNHSVEMMHTVMHQSACRHFCLTCLVGFPTERKMVEHVVFFHDRRDIAWELQCPFSDCNAQFSGLYGLKKHINTIHGWAMKHVSPCGTRFATRFARLFHESLHDISGSEQCCLLCGKCDVWEAEVGGVSVKHIMAHGITSYFCCDICGYHAPRDNQADHLQEHYSLTHVQAERTKATCQACNQHFWSYPTLMQHFEERHRMVVFYGSDPTNSFTIRTGSLLTSSLGLNATFEDVARS